MIFSQKLHDEEGRLFALRRYDVLDTAPEQPFDKLTGLVRNVLSVPIAAVSLIDAKRQWFKSIAGLSACEMSRDISFCAHAIKQRGPMIVPDATQDPRFANNPLVTGSAGIRSYLGIPLETPDGYNLGALCAIDTVARTFSTNEIAILSSFANLVMNELELRQIAMSDVLTGATTRRGWFEAAEIEFKRSRRHGSDASIVVFDIDHFKHVNDAYGHPAGDIVLRALAQRCNETLRASDVFGRIGGEEFAILLPETNIGGAIDLAERLRKKFADTPIDLNGVEIYATASFGISPLDASITDVNAWLASADGYLYQSKAKGRNVCSWNLELS